MSLWGKIASQFGNPTGLLGSLAGFIMAGRSSNLERTSWAVSMLDLQAEDQVLEIGYGPGVAIQQMSGIVTKGIVYGIDRSEVMLKQATKRNKPAMLSGNVVLWHDLVSNIPSLNSPFDKTIDINSFQFWENPVDDLVKVRSLMQAGGKIILVHQPRKPGSTDVDTDAAGIKFSNYLQKAGFKEIKKLKKAMKPVSTVCVMAIC